MDRIEFSRYNTGKPHREGFSMMFYTGYHSPIGMLTLTSDGHSLTGLWMDTQAPDLSGGTEVAELPLFREVSAWLDGYFRSEQIPLTFPLLPQGTAFQRQVWEILLQIPWGETTSYGAIARQISPTMSAQAVGGAVGRNPISIIIPCHRCVGARGQLTGYAGGLEKKTWLLNHEQPNNARPERRN
jgi:methylated-DNA-[protein]-cysteine S-methyltransferase